MSGVQTAADLRAAAEVLRRDGWTQGLFHRDGRHCVLGALQVATGAWPSGHFTPGQLTRFDDTRFALMPIVGDSVSGWSDAPGRTADEVIAALEAAADAAEASDA